MKKIFKALFFVYQWLITFPVLLVITILTAVVTIAGTALGSQACAYWPAHIWSRCVCTLWMVRVKVIGRENIDRKQSYVFVANHQGAFDIWSIYGYLNHPFKWLMKKELEKIPLVGYACRRAGHVFVDDSSIMGIKETIADAEHTIRDGMSVVIFPEGSRTFDGHLTPFKRGAFMLAAEFGLPVVPISIDGSFRAMPRTTYCVTPGTVTLRIHEPIIPGPNGFNTKRLMADCRDIIAADVDPVAED